MKQSANTDSGQMQSPGGPNPNTGGSANTGNRNLVLLLIIGILVVGAGVVVYVLYSLSSTSAPPTLTQNRSASSTPIYLGPAQAAVILNSSLENYDSADLYNPDSPINMSGLEAVVPDLYGNVTSGWITTASGSNLTSNASIEYYVFETSNATAISGALYSAITSSFNVTIPTSYGTENGLDYSYGIYKNATYGTQILSGWKNNEVVFVIIQSYPSFTANETSLIRIAANETP